MRELAIGWKHSEEIFMWLLERGKHDDDLRVRLMVAGELARGWKEDSRLLPWLRERIQFSQGVHQAYQALHEVGRSCKDDPDALPWLQKVSQSEEDWVLRSFAANELSKQA